MDFKENKAIYLQIADNIGDRILSGELPADGKIPSVREMAAEIEVNPNTVARTYEYLQQQGVIYTRRGLGYFVAADAAQIVVRERRNALMQGELDYFFGRLKAVGISPGELKALYEDYLK